MPQISSCGGILQGPSGTFNTINWPNEAYPINTDCEWVIECPGSNQVINLSFDSQFKVAGQPPLCSKDRVEVVDCARGVTHGPYCHTTRPNPLRQLGNSARVRFITKGQRGSTRTGFKASYTCVDGPTTLTTTARPTTQRPTTMHPTTLPTTPRPTTTHRPTTPRPTTIAPTSPPATPSIISATCPVPQISSCGGILQGSRGTFNTINWPNEAYPINTDCEWVIECPGSNQVINLSFDSQFKVAGQPPLCSKDRVEVVDCARGVTHGPYCYTTRPNPLRQLGNSARVRFITKGQRGSSRTGFKASYSCVDGPTALPTTQQPTTGVLPTTPHPAISTQPASATTDSASCSLLQLIDISGGTFICSHHRHLNSYCSDVFFPLAFLVRPLFSFSSDIPPPAVRAGGPLPIPLTLEILHGRSVLLLEFLLILQCTVKFCGVKGQHACTIETMAPAERLGFRWPADEKLKIEAL